MIFTMPKAALSALGLELLLFLLIAFVATPHEVKRVEHPVVQLVLVSPAPVIRKPDPVQKVDPPVVEQPEPEPPKEIVTSEPAPVVHKKPIVHKKHKIHHKRAKKHVVKHPPIQKPVAAPAIKKSVPAPVIKKVLPKLAVEQTRPAPPVINDSYRNAVRASVQHAMKYPLAAKISQITGKVRVSFRYFRGKVSDAKILISSGTGVLDRAALEAVENAEIPSPSGDLLGESMIFEVWVKFFMEDS